MSELEPEATDEVGSPAESEPVRTGDEAVDGVLDSLEGLDERPVDEHVAVFEAAHERLRGALDARP
ncbi:MAG TPA: hypothetical protein VFJ89_00805 [Nocardioides sp.]|nr:hypothetical protein [Nocardioides sp.]